MKHTPGPWEVSKIGNPYDQFMIYAESDSGRNICVAVEGESNAALIAAAPDLLEACKEIKAEISNCIEFINDRTPSTDQQTISKLYSKLGKLIDKAEGRE